VICNVTPVSLDIFCDFDVAQLEMSGWTVGQVGDDKTIGDAIILVDHHDVGVLVDNRLLDHLLDGTALTPQWSRIGNYPGQFLDKRQSFLHIQKKNQNFSDFFGKNNSSPQASPSFR
jgi:hypothetical protein